jgi:5-methylcytosine-specific restriction endonuclease McrBC regulatory subunit McrC
MGQRKIQLISAKDCSPFDNLNDIKNVDEVLTSIAHDFLSDSSVFHFLSNHRNKEEDIPFVQWAIDNSDKYLKWFAGRWVGAATYIFQNKVYTFSVSPRFGNLSLYVLLEEIFSINILNNLSEVDVSNIDSLLQKLIPFIWAQKLGEANKYGIPHTTIDVLHKGPNVKGRLLIRKSILPFFKQKEVVSATREKQVDATICRIILQAYNLLNKNKAMNIRSRMSENAENALINFENARIPDARVTLKQYNDIRYKSIYESWRGIVDFSWQIIQNHNFLQKESENSKGFGMFVDMAEIWEMFLRSKLRKSFPDWDVSSPEIDTYNGTFFKRKIIPDIVMKKGNDVMLFDAKWKRMQFNNFDVDRSDFFQIHTYIQYYKQMGYNVVASGLLYPISVEEDGLMNNRYSTLFGNSSDSTVFIVDGICFGEEKNADGDKLDKGEIERWESSFDRNVEFFINRIRKIFS